MTKPLLALHKLLIASAAALSLLVAASGFFRWQGRRLPIDLVVAALAVSSAVALGFYLRYFSRRSRRPDGRGVAPPGRRPAP